MVSSDPSSPAGVAPTPPRIVDLRSDAVTRPGPAMWQAMATDPLSWSRLVAALLDRPASLFVPTGTMANTLALWCWTEPGDTFVVDERAHVIRSEDDAYAWLARLSQVTVPGVRGHPTSGQLESVLRGADRPSLLWLENTHTFAGGTIAPGAQLLEVAQLARDSGMHVHLDGARLWNAAAATGRSPAELAAPVDSVTVNLDKGLGCPAGAVLCGGRELIAQARARMLGLGGVLAQAGLFAACGLVALSDPVTSLARDHELATLLADGLRRHGRQGVDRPETNIVLVRLRRAEDACVRLAELGVLALARDHETIRLVTHRDVGQADIEHAVTALGGMGAW